MNEAKVEFGIQLHTCPTCQTGYKLLYPEEVMRAVGQPLSELRAATGVTICPHCEAEERLRVYTPRA